MPRELTDFSGGIRDAAAVYAVAAGARLGLETDSLRKLNELVKAAFPVARPEAFDGLTGDHVRLAMFGIGVACGPSSYEEPAGALALARLLRIGLSESQLLDLLSVIQPLRLEPEP